MFSLTVPKWYNCLVLIFSEYKLIEFLHPSNDKKIDHNLELLMCSGYIFLVYSSHRKCQDIITYGSSTLCFSCDTICT